MSTNSPIWVLKLALNEKINDKIRSYSKFLQTVSESDRSSLQLRLLSPKLMKEQLIAMTALAKAEAIFAEMDLLVAENNVKTAIKQLDKLGKEYSLEQLALEKPSTDRPESTKSKTPKDPIIPAYIEPPNKNTQVESINGNIGMQSIETNKSASHIVGSQTVEEFRPATKKSNKRQREKRSESRVSKSKQKKSKLKHDSKTITTIEEKSTLLGTTLSPISKCQTTSVTKVDQTYRDWINRRAKSTNGITNNIEDENTILIEDYSGHSSHRHVINLSKVLQRVIPPRTQIQDDLSQRPVLSKIQLLFEDDPAELKKRSSNVKTEVSDSDPLNNSTEQLVNSLFKDIMQAKVKNVAKQASNSSYTMSGTSPFCKVKLREILEQC